MFSLTTIASSINRPTHRDKAISVTMFTLNPKICMNKKVPKIEMGMVSPVITVERQEPKNKKTIITVKIAPSIKVSRTLLTDTLIILEPS